MRFLCDVHISYKIANHLKSFGFEAVHVNEILNKSETKDSEICKYADIHNFILITKDSDFRDSYFIKKTPRKLIKINLGNISNEELKRLLSDNIVYFKKLDETKPHFMVEMDKDFTSLINNE